MCSTVFFSMFGLSSRTNEVFLNMGTYNYERNSTTNVHSLFRQTFNRISRSFKTAGGLETGQRELEDEP